MEAAFIHRSQPTRYGGRVPGESLYLPEFVAEGRLEPKRRVTLRPLSSGSFATIGSAPNAAPGQRQPKLLDRVRNALRLRHRSPKTEKAYVAWIYRFIVFNDKRHPSEMAAAEIERFLSSLAVERGVSASTQNQIENATSPVLVVPRGVTVRFPIAVAA